MADMSSSEVFSDRYELVRHIARGGMAQVYLAQDLLLDRPVAIKVLFPELSSDPSFVERFRREAQAAANLSHANIVSIYDWGQGERTYFIVMEYIDGQTLSSVIRRGALPAQRAATIGSDIAGALDFAHRRGVIHRDVKPGNVLMDRAGQVKVADFGIARAVSNASEGLTQTGAVMGTATYFSPEQAQGLPVDARSDVYSLGVVLYEMVTGKPPFSGDSPVAIAYKHVREYPPVPSTINAAVPSEYEAIVTAAMAKDPDDRYQSAGDLRDDLVRFQRGQPVLAAHPAPHQQTRTISGPPGYYRADEPTYVAHDTGVMGAPEPAYAAPYATAEINARRSRAGWWAALFVALLAVLLALVFFIGRNAGWWGHGGDLRVPSVKGQTLSQAKATLASDGFSKPTVHYEDNGLVQSGLVIGTSPGAGSNVPPKTTIVVDVSSGPPKTAVPSVKSLTCSAADLALKAKSFAYKNDPRNSATVRSGHVISTNPASGVKRSQGSTVTVYCSAGQATTVVPDLQGLTPAVAGARLYAAHLGVGNTRPMPSSTIKPGLVDYTDPSQGNVEPWGYKVNLIVSDGQAMTVVPTNLKGETQAQAEKELAAASLYGPVEMQAVTNPAQNGYVINTHPQPGASIRQGTAVTLFVGEYTGPPASSSTTAPSGSTTTAPGVTTSATSATSATPTAPASTTVSTVAGASTTSSPAATTTAPGSFASTTTPGPAGDPGAPRGHGGPGGPGGGAATTGPG